MMLPPMFSRRRHLAIGAGTDVAVAAADIVLVRNNPLEVISIIEFG